MPPASTHNEFTPTERKILAVLSDGMKHKREELFDCIPDEQSNVPIQVANHISNIRRKLRRKGQDIDCVYYMGGYYYRHCRLLVDPNDGLR